MLNRAYNSALSPELKSWLDHCFVPLLVREFLSECKKETIDVGGGVVAELLKRKKSSREVVQ